MKKLTAILLALTLVLTLLPMAVLADDPPQTEPDETTIIPLVDDCDHANLTHVDAVPATCSTDGNIEYWVCTDCGRYFADDACTTEITADETVTTAPHALEHEAGYAATCTADGLAEHWFCTNCGKVFADEAGATELNETDLVLPATGHTLQYAAEDNVITETCANCDHSATATITATGATYTGEPLETATVAYSEGWEGGDLEIVYANNVEVGDATASITISGATASTTFAIASATRKGDMDGNGTINMRDLLTLRQYLAGGYGVVLTTAVGDLDGNGSINMRDLLTLRQYLAGGYGIVL